MADLTATYALELEDQMSGPAADAANALGNLKGKIDQDVKALSSMRKALRNLRGGTGAASSAIVELKDKISAQRATISAAQLKFIELGGSFDMVGAKAKKAKKELDTFQMPAIDIKAITDLAKELEPKEVQTFSSALGEMGSKLSTSEGAVSSLGGSMSRLATLMSNPLVAIGAITTALTAMAAATVGVISTLARYALAQSDASRADLLRLDSLSATRREHGLLVTTGNDLQNAIGNVAEITGTGRQELERYARQLERTGLAGKSLTDALETRALEELGPNARREILSLERQSNRLRAGLQRIFSGLRIDTFLGAINQITNQFSQTTASGRALKAIVESMFQPIFDATGTLGPILRSFFEGMIIGALFLTISFLRLRNAIRSALGDSEFLSNAEAIELATKAGMLAVSALAGTLIFVGAVMAAVALSAATVVAAFLAIPVALNALSNTAGELAKSAFDAVMAVDWIGLGRNVVSGIASGIDNGLSTIRSSVTGLANSAREAFTGALGISSPSRVFAEYGINIAQGVTGGIESGSGAVDSAVSGLVEVPTGGGGVRGSATSISIGDVNINAGETSDPRELAQAFADQLASLLEGVSVEVGAT